MSHVVCSPKTTSLLKESISSLDLPEIQVLNWCSTRMGGFLKACEKVATLIVPLFDTLVTGNIKEDQRSVLKTPTSTYLIFLLADLSRNHYQKYLHTVDSDTVIITETHGIAMKAAEAFSTDEDEVDTIETPSSDRFIESLELDEFGNLSFKVSVKGKENSVAEEHVVRLNFQHRGRRGTDDDVLPGLQQKLLDLKKKVLSNIEGNIQDQNTDTLASYFSCLDLDSTEDLDQRLENVNKLWHTFGKDTAYDVPGSIKYCGLKIQVMYMRKIKCGLDELRKEFRRALHLPS